MRFEGLLQSSKLSLGSGSFIERYEVAFNESFGTRRALGLCFNSRADVD